MRLLLLIASLLAFAAPAAAQSTGLRPAPPAAGRAARPVAPAAATPMATQAAPLQTMRLPPPTRSLAVGAAFRGLAPVGDAAPMCRAQCSNTRTTCAATDDDQCVDRWRQCVAACSRGAPR